MAILLDHPVREEAAAYPRAVLKLPSELCNAAFPIAVFPFPFVRNSAFTQNAALSNHESRFTRDWNPTAVL
jgi:hypothetical protein